MKKVLITIIKYLAIYYLSAKMICFAIPKMLFMQFRITHWESYAPLVEISKYQHMWSFFGRSYNYNLFIALTEFIIGVLIVFKRTRLIALLISLGLCLNILILNIEFEVSFAIAHVSLDLAITLALLAGYRFDLYSFFIRMGGKINGSPAPPANKFARVFPYAFLLLLSVSYFAFSYHIKATYIADENVVGSYQLKAITVNDSPVDFDKGSIGRTPMMFIEHNNQVVLSVEDTLYMGQYLLKDRQLSIYLNRPTRFGMTSLQGSLLNDTISGTTDKEQSIQLILQRMDGSKDYLNELYR